jgi:precorrin-2 methylase
VNTFRIVVRDYIEHVPGVSSAAFVASRIVSVPLRPGTAGVLACPCRAQPRTIIESLDQLELVLLDAARTISESVDQLELVLLDAGRRGRLRSRTMVSPASMNNSNRSHIARLPVCLNDYLASARRDRIG